MKQLAKGIKEELEHAHSFKTIQKNHLGVHEAAKMVAMDHLKQDPFYYFRRRCNGK